MWILARMLCDEDYCFNSTSLFSFHAKDIDEAKTIVIRKMKDDFIRKEDIEFFRNMDIRERNTIGVWDEDEVDYIVYKLCAIEDIKSL